MIELNDKTFNDEISADIPVVVDFWAPWCGPCRSQTPIMEQFAEKYESKVKVCKVNTDDNPALCKQFGIMSIPTIMVFKNGELVDKAVGVQSLESLISLAKL